MDNKLKLLKEDILRKTYSLQKYYKKNDGLTLIGANDSLGVNLGFLGKGLITGISKFFNPNEIDLTLIDACSMHINKTEYVKSFLVHNLSKEEIKLSQYYSLKEAVRKVMTDFHIPPVLAEATSILYPIFKPGEKDKTIFMADTLRDAKEPTFLYSSGVNDLTREVCNNPASLQLDYLRRDKTPNYQYTLDKCKNPESLQKVSDSIKENMELILGMNPSTDIYALGIYLPMNLKEKECTSLFQGLIDSYNDQLGSLCKNYHVTYIDLGSIAESYCRSGLDFHINKEGHSFLAAMVVDAMYQKKNSGIRVYKYKRLSSISS